MPYYFKIGNQIATAMNRPLGLLYIVKSYYLDAYVMTALIHDTKNNRLWLYDLVGGKYIILDPVTFSPIRNVTSNFAEAIGAVYDKKRHKIVIIDRHMESITVFNPDDYTVIIRVMPSGFIKPATLVHDTVRDVYLVISSQIGTTWYVNPDTLAVTVSPYIFPNHIDSLHIDNVNRRYFFSDGVQKKMIVYDSATETEINWDKHNSQNTLPHTNAFFHDWKRGVYVLANLRQDGISAYLDDLSGAIYKGIFNFSLGSVEQRSIYDEIQDSWIFGTNRNLIHVVKL